MNWTLLRFLWWAAVFCTSGIYSLWVWWMGDIPSFVHGFAFAVAGDKLFGSRESGLYYQISRTASKTAGTPDSDSAEDLRQSIADIEIEVTRLRGWISEVHSQVRRLSPHRSYDHRIDFDRGW